MVNGNPNNFSLTLLIRLNACCVVSDCSIRRAARCFSGDLSGFSGIFFNKVVILGLNLPANKEYGDEIRLRPRVSGAGLWGAVLDGIRTS